MWELQARWGPGTTPGTTRPRGTCGQKGQTHDQDVQTLLRELDARVAERRRERGVDLADGEVAGEARAGRRARGDAEEGEGAEYSHC